MVQDQCD